MNRPVRFILFTGFLLILFNSHLLGAEPHEGLLYHPSKGCQTPPLPKWSEQEKWVWKQICEGKIADFNQRYIELDPKKPDGWTKVREINPEFLEGILFEEQYSSVITRKGVGIIGAWFTKPINLEGATIKFKLSLNHCRFEEEVNFSDTNFQKDLSVAGSTFESQLKMVRLIVNGNLKMNNSAKFGNVVDLYAANIKDTILMNDSFFHGRLDMEAITVGRHLIMRDSKFEDEIELFRASIDDDLDMASSIFKALVNMQLLVAGGQLKMWHGARFDKVDLTRAQIGDVIDTSDSTFNSYLDMQSISINRNFHTVKTNIDELNLDSSHIGGVLRIEKSTLNKACLNYSDIGHSLIIQESTINGPLELQSIRVAQHIFLKRSIFKRTYLAGSHVNGHIIIQGSSSSGDFEMAWLKVNGDLLITDKSEFSSWLKIQDSDIGSSIRISNSTFKNVSLSGTQVADELQLGDEFKPRITWKEPSRLILANMSVGKLNDIPEAWPKDLELDGFTYTQFGTSDSAWHNYFSRDIQWFVDWLAKDRTYTPQPYIQLASILRESGQKHISVAVLYAGKERELSAASFPRNLGLFLQKIFIGYGIGYRYFYALIWVVLFVRIGVGVLRLYGDDKGHEINLGHAYSLDMLLPIIRLRESHYKIELSEAASKYFYFHKIMGYVLAFFLIAGLSGMTK